MKNLSLTEDRFRQLQEIAAVRRTASTSILGELIGHAADQLPVYRVCRVEKPTATKPIRIELLGGEISLEIAPSEALALARGFRRVIEQGGTFVDQFGGGTEAKMLRIVRRGPAIEIAHGAAYLRKIVNDVASEIARKLQAAALAADPTLASL